MGDLKKIGQDVWNDAYARGGNITFYPNEEVVRFINRYVRKRKGISEFVNIMDISENSWKDFKSLDLGCGIGRHVRIMEEFNLYPYGIDLSETAIQYGKMWFDELGLNDVSSRLSVGSVAELPYNDGFFDIVISESVLDSMPRGVADQGIKETYRVIKEHGLFFLSLIMDTDRKDEEIIVGSGYEKDTVQSFFTQEGIDGFLKDYFDIIDINIVYMEDVFKKGSYNRFEENMFLKDHNDKVIKTSQRAYIVAKRKL